VPSTGQHNTRGVATSAELSCGTVCNKRLGCGNHSCTRICHDGPCPPCEVREQVQCYCGKDDKEVTCGQGEAEVCEILENGKVKTWFGRYACEQPCERPFDCGNHHCSKSCHPPSRTPPPCPRSPSVLTHCPCGKHLISPNSSSYFPPGAFLVRGSCSAPVPTCTSICGKTLEGCDHPCGERCHEGPCPPCARPVVRPCRCGNITRTVVCAKLKTTGEILCDRPCRALRACGRHTCGRVCCPLATLAVAGGAKGKRRARAADEIVDVEGLHECDLVCGKALACGNHTCEERDHRGTCPPCLRSSFDEVSPAFFRPYISRTQLSLPQMICNCGRTVLMPPIPCGTRLSCTYPCTRPPPACGHGRTPHACHADDVNCPPCPFLTRKLCACGKREVDNVRCSQEKVACGTVCGKLLGCGFHRCTKLCHGDDCGPCTTTCGKPRKLWYDPLLVHWCYRSELTIRS
jgi:transcriptional repressor NF-X1